MLQWLQVVYQIVIKTQIKNKKLMICVILILINLSSERNFSYIGLTLSDRRSQLKSFNVNELFIRANYDLCD